MDNESVFRATNRMSKQLYAMSLKDQVTRENWDSIRLNVDESKRGSAGAAENDETQGGSKNAKTRKLF